MTVLELMKKGHGDLSPSAAITHRDSVCNTEDFEHMPHVSRANTQINLECAEVFSNHWGCVSARADIIYIVKSEI